MSSNEHTLQSQYFVREKLLKKMHFRKINSRGHTTVPHLQLDVKNVSFFFSTFSYFYFQATHHIHKGGSEDV